MKTVAIVDYDMGNLRSVQKAVEYLGCRAELCTHARCIAGASHVILPGVGAFGDAMARLEETGMKTALVDYMQSGRPLLGICLGMQLLFAESQEFGTFRGLDVMDGVVERLPDGVDRLKIPHMGWNTVQADPDCPLLSGLDGADFYFVHSFAVRASRCAVGWTTYGGRFVSVVQKGLAFGTQFHPEKSGEAGLELYRNWLQLG